MYVHVHFSACMHGLASFEQVLHHLSSIHCMVHLGRVCNAESCEYVYASIVHVLTVRLMVTEYRLPVHVKVAHITSMFEA